MADYRSVELAERQATTDPTGIAREFKRRVGDTTPIYAGGATFTPEGLTAHVLRWVVEQAVERMGERPAQVTLTHPATWTTFNIEKLVAAAELAGLNGVRTCPEPVAAAHHYAAHHSVAVGDRICIYDLGGGTFDVCVLVKTDEGFEILGKPTGIPFLGGADFDQLIISAVVEGLSALNCDVDPDDPGIAALRRECVDAKEALSADVEAVIPVRLQGVSTIYRITRSEFEAMIDAAIELTIEATGHALRSAGIAAGDLAAIVLVGGSSRIPLVSQKLEHAFKCRIAVNTHPKHEVAWVLPWRVPKVPTASRSVSLSLLGRHIVGGRPHLEHFELRWPRWRCRARSSVARGRCHPSPQSRAHRCLLLHSPAHRRPARPRPHRSNRRRRPQLHPSPPAVRSSPPRCRCRNQREQHHSRRLHQHPSAGLIR